MKALVLLAEGVEEMEAVIAIDLLRRAKWDVTAAGLEAGPLTASRGVRLVPDRKLEGLRADDFDVLVVPGGAGGVKRLRAHAGVLELVRQFDRAGKTIAAVCAGPLVLQQAGILEGRNATCHPDVAGELTAARRSDARVVVDGHLLTSQGAGTCFEFALALVARHDGPEAAARIARGIVWAGAAG